MINPNIKRLEEAFHAGMKHNFQNDGYLAPIVFYLVENQAYTKLIPEQSLSSKKEKEILISYVKNLCKQGVEAIGIICQGNAVILDIDDKDVTELTRGKKSVTDIKNNKEVIMMVFSCPFYEKNITYIVDLEKRQILEKLPEEGKAEGLFTGFFNWTLN